VSLRRRLIVFGYPLLEILTIIGVAYLIGWGWTILILIAGVPIGFTVMSRAGRSAFASMREASRDGRIPDGSSGTHALSFLAGALIAVPGLWTDLVGILLLIEPVQHLVRRKFGPRVTTFTSTAGGLRPPSFGASDVIKGTVIHTSDADPKRSEQPNGPEHTDGPAGSGPSGAVGLG